MTLVEKGHICDICGGMIHEDKIQPIEIIGIPEIFHVHKLTPGAKGEICRDVLRKAAMEKNWRLLPDCYLKEAYATMAKAQDLLNIAEKEGGEKEVLRVAGEILKTI
ncbi:MAG: hypothetical protein KAR42_16820 [candidate division Zixibacteria bacterium]|nr:hypothetical protein [candidate division Zixibacteria bacterium]